MVLFDRLGHEPRDVFAGVDHLRGPGGGSEGGESAFFHHELQGKESLLA